MTLAEQAREAVRNHPFVYDALAAGVLNYSAAARFLDVGEEEAVAAALRRYGEELTDELPETDVRVSMETGLGRGAGDALVTVGESSFVPGAGSLTAVLITGSVSVGLFRQVFGKLDAEGVDLQAAGFTDDTALVVVDRRAGPDTLRFVEAVCE